MVCIKFRIPKTGGASYVKDLQKKYFLEGYELQRLLPKHCDPTDFNRKDSPSSENRAAK